MSWSAQIDNHQLQMHAFLDKRFYTFFQLRSQNLPDFFGVVAFPPQLLPAAPFTLLSKESGRSAGVAAD